MFGWPHDDGVVDIAWWCHCGRSKCSLSLSFPV